MATTPTTRETTTSATETTVEPEPDDGRNQGPVRIATLGDSNTESGFWRAGFLDVFAAEGCEVDMIGRRNVAWSGGLDRYDLDTDAVSGAFMATSINPSNAIFQHGRATLNSGRADVVIVVGGTNDVLDEQRKSNSLDQLDQRLNEAQQHLRDAIGRSPGSAFLVADIVQLRGGEDLVNHYNAGLQRIAGEVGAGHIDIATSTSDLGDDGVHFTERGGRAYGAAIARRAIAVARSDGLC